MFGVLSQTIVINHSPTMFRRSEANHARPHRNIRVIIQIFLAQKPSVESARQYIAATDIVVSIIPRSRSTCGNREVGSAGAESLGRCLCDITKCAFRGRKADSLMR